MPLARQSTVVGNRAFQGRKNARSYRGKKRVYRKKPYRKKRFRRYTAPSVRPLIKGHKFAGHDDMSLFGTAPAGGESYDPKEWYIFNPLMLNRVSNATPSDTDRQSNAIFARNSRAEFQFIPSKRCIQGFQVRLCAGWFKGDDNKGTQGLMSNDLKVIYPDIHTLLNSKQNPATDDFKWIYSKTYTFVPRQIYDEDTEEGDHAGADRTLVALWTPRTIRFNFKHMRKQTYEGADGDSLNGWNPIICLQCKPLEGGTAFTRPTLPASADTGVNPSPRIHSSMLTYFNDIN
tara:strand:+ start:588 stop:1454 length:867 start_codon:yes stop_codon:yes gene_type:complete